MQARSTDVTRQLEIASTHLMIERLEMRTVRLPLKEPFETSFGSIDSRLIFLVSIEAGGWTGWGEVVAAEEPRYSYETVGTARETPVWCGGMLESGIGRAHNIALASLPGFCLPGDISASSRYFARDVIAPEVTVAGDGTVEVPRGPGLGFEVDLDCITANTQTVERFENVRLKT